MTRFKHQILLWILTTMTFWSYGQINDTARQDTTDKFTIVETMPEFPGGVERLYKIIEDNLEYPESALKDRVGGKVITQFVVDTSGNVVNIQILKGIREDINQEAIRLVGLLNGWTPGTQKGKKVKVQYQLPLTFYPDNEWRKKYKKKERKK